MITKQTEIQKAFQIKNLLDTKKITSQEANKRMNNEFIILGGFTNNK